MKRRQVILGLGASATGGSALIGSGAFSSVEAKRDISVEVAGDDSAYLRLAPCTDEQGNEKPNGAYAFQGEDGLFSISLSDNNENSPPDGSGVNPEALSKFHNVFEICNQGTQEVCVNFGIDGDVPTIPEGAHVPDRFDFGTGDDAVVFYKGSDESDTFDITSSDADDGFELDVGDCQCFGFNVRAFGFDSGEDLFADTDLTIIADADAECTVEEPGCALINGEYGCTVYGKDGGTYDALSSEFTFENTGTVSTDYGYAIINDPDADSDEGNTLEPGETNEGAPIAPPNPHTGVVFWSGDGVECAPTWGNIKQELEEELVNYAEEETSIEDDDFAQEIVIPDDVANTLEDEFSDELDDIPEDDFPEILDDYDVEPYDEEN